VAVTLMRARMAPKLAQVSGYRKGGWGPL
jgi:hypothetical protein